MIQGKSIVLYITGLIVVLGLVWFGAYHFFFHDVESDSSVQELLESHTAEETDSTRALDCVVLLGIDTEEGNAGR